MNPALIPFALKGANSAYKYLREQDGKRERDIYSSLLENLKDGDLDDVREQLKPEELERLHGAARASAGDITRDLHDRLDRRRADFAATAPARKAYREELLQEAKDKKKEGSSTFGKVAKWTLAAAGTAAGAWACWEFFLKEKLSGDKQAAKTYTAAPTRTETDAQGGTTLVYSTRTEDAREADAQAARQTPAAGRGERVDGFEDGGVHPAEEGAASGNAARTGREDLGRPGLSTLDTLDDDQRGSTSGNR